jgi:hypothetical protein
MQPDLIGIDSVCKAIEQAPYFQWRIHARNPAISKDGGIDESAVKYAAIDIENHQTASEMFRNWAELVTKHNPNNTNVYWLEMCRLNHTSKPGAPQKYTPLIQTFVLGSMYMQSGQTPSINAPNMQGPAPAPAPAAINGAALASNGYNQKQVDIMLENQRLQIENERLKLERELLEEEDDEDDEEEDDDNDLLGSIGVKDPEMKSVLYTHLGQIAAHFAAKLTGGAAMAGADSNVISDLQAIQKAAPEAGQVITRLAKIAKSNPDQVNEFINSILPHLPES